MQRVLVAALVLFPLAVHAETGADAWLRYERLAPSMAAQVRQRQAGRKDAVLSKLALRQLHLRVRLELQVEGEEGREHNRVSRPLLKLPLRLSVVGGNPRAERKKARKLLLHRAPNNTNLV